MQLLIIDNHDSFTYNLVQLVTESNLCNYTVIKNNKIDLKQIANYDKILISPGPGLPKETENLMEIIEKYHSSKSILGVCLGFQAISEFFGAKLYNLKQVYHGLKVKIKITNINEYIFADLPKKIKVGLYHSWAVSKIELPQCLSITAISDDDIIMAISHKKYNIRGSQFHPESIMTAYGKQIIENFLRNKKSEPFAN